MNDEELQPFYDELVIAIDQASGCEDTRRFVMDVSRAPRTAWTRPAEVLVQSVLYGWEKEFSVNDFDEWTNEDVAAGLFILMRMLATPLSRPGSRLYAALSYLWLPLASSRLLVEEQKSGR